MRRRLSVLAAVALTALVFALAPVVAEETAIPPGYPGDGPYWDPMPAIDAIRPSVVGLVVELPPLMSDGQPRLVGGTGVVYRPGYVVTNAHVVQGASRVRLLLHGGSLALTQSDRIWVDPVSDIAVLEFSAVSLPAPVWADSDRLKEGQMVVAVGNPGGFRLGNTATVGVISGTARILAGGYPPQSWGSDPPLIQTDAPINPGNSGGPVVNARGEVVGLAQSKLADLGVEGLGFALPANLVRRVADELIARHGMTWPWVGALFEEDPGARYGARPAGLTVAEVAPGSPADGVLQPGDQVAAVGLLPVRDLDGLNRALAGQQVGDPISLLIERDGAEQRVALALAARPALYPLPDGDWLWGPLAADQAVQAAEWAVMNRAAPAAALTLPYRTATDQGEALLRSEFLQLAHSLHQRLAAGKPVRDNEFWEWAGMVRDRLYVEVAVAARPGDLPVQAELVQGHRAIAGQAASLPFGTPDDLSGAAAPADTGARLVRGTFRFPSTGVWADLPLTLVVRSAAGTELARFEWDLTRVR